MSEFAMFCCPQCREQIVKLSDQQSGLFNFIGIVCSNCAHMIGEQDILHQQERDVRFPKVGKL